MEDDFDLRSYIYTLIRYWPWILAVSLGLGVVMLAQSWLAPDRYQSEAMVGIIRPLYQYQFSSAIRNQAEAVSAQAVTGKTALDLVTSDDLLQQILNEIKSDLPARSRNQETFRKMLSARAGSDSSILILSVTDSDAQRAAKIANIWSELSVQRINKLYAESADQLTFFDEQLAQAKNELDKADQALVDWQKRSDLAVLGAQLSTKQGALGSYLALNESLELLLQNVMGLHDQLSRLPADTPSTLGDDLTALALQVNAFNAQSGVPLQLQMPATGSLSNKTVGQQAAFLADLRATIEAKQIEAQKQAEALPEEIKSLQGRMQEARTEETRLTRQRGLVENFYTALAQKVGETRIIAQDTTGRARLAGNAVAPDRPLSKRRLPNAAMGLALGLILSVVGVFIVEYFRAPAKMAARPRVEPVLEIAEE